MYDGPVGASKRLALALGLSVSFATACAGLLGVEDVSYAPVLDAAPPYPEASLPETGTIDGDSGPHEAGQIRCESEAPPIFCTAGMQDCCFNQGYRNNCIDRRSQSCSTSLEYEIECASDADCADLGLPGQICCALGNPDLSYPPSAVRCIPADGGCPLPARRSCRNLTECTYPDTCTPINGTTTVCLH